MQKIEKLTATKVQHDKSTLLTIQIKLDNGLLVQTSVPVTGMDTERSGLKSVQIVNDIISQIFEGLNPLRQKELDKMITELSEVHNQDTVSTNISFAVSMCILKAAAAIHGTSLSGYLQNTYGFTDKQNHSPVLVYTIEQNSGQLGEFREFFIIPSRSCDIEQSFILFREMFNRIKREIPVEENSGEEIMNTVQLELLYNRIAESPYQLHRDIFIGIYPGLNYDEHKGYVCNDMLTHATAEQLVDYYGEIQTLYSPLIVENPVRIADLSAYISLHNKIGDQTILTINSDYVDSIQTCKRVAGIVPTAMLSLKHTSVKSVTHCIELLQSAEKEEWKTMMDTNGSGDKSVLLALGSAAGCDFMKIDSCSAEIEKECVYAGKAD